MSAFNFDVFTIAEAIKATVCFEGHSKPHRRITQLVIKDIFTYSLYRF